MENGDKYFLGIALKEAKKAFNKDEVPVGAIIVLDNKIIAKAYNLKEAKEDVTQHAELRVIKKAQKKIKDWRLSEFTLYSTLEPCPMCAGAIIHSRIKRLVFSAKDNKWGAAGTIVDLFSQNLFNHNVEVDYFSMTESEEILRAFFRKLRH